MGATAAISGIADSEVAYKSSLAGALIACGIAGFSVGKRYINKMYNHQ